MVTRNQFDFIYYESGPTGMVEITSPFIPNPNATPLETDVKSTQQRVELVDGSRGYLTPETKYVDEPVKFTWQFQSGDTFQHKWKQLARDNTLVTIQSNVRERTWTGKVVSAKERVIPWGSQDFSDIVVTLEQQDG